MSTQVKGDRSDSQRSSSEQSRPPSGPPPSSVDTGDGAAEDRYNDLFGKPDLDKTPERESPFEVSSPDTPPPDPPPLGVRLYAPQRALYESAFEAAYKYPDDLMLVMQGVRKGLKRGKEAATEAGGLDR